MHLNADFLRIYQDSCSKVQIDDLDGRGCVTVSIEIRGLLIQSVIDGIADGSLELGAGVRRLRVEVAKMQQTEFARMCKISVRALIQIEQGESNPTLQSLSTVFRPFGLQMGVIRRPDRRWIR